MDFVPGLTLTLDYGRFVAAGIPSGEIHSLLPYATYVHVRAGAPGKLQTTLNENTIDFAGIVSRLSKRRHRGYLAVEYVCTEWQQCNRTDNVSETLLLRRMLKELSQKAPQREDFEKGTVECLIFPVSLRSLVTGAATGVGVSRVELRRSARRAMNYSIPKYQN